MRTLEQIESAAKNTPAGEKLVISHAEVDLLIAWHQRYRVQQGKIAPDKAYLMKKIASGKTRMHGRALEVK